MPDNAETHEHNAIFNFSAYPSDTLFHERRDGAERRAVEPAPAPNPKTAERRAKTERRRRIDPTTFEKQYSPDELEFMNAMQQFKMRSGKAFPSYGEVLKVAIQLGYARVESACEPAPDLELVSQ